MNETSVEEQKLLPCPSAPRVGREYSHERQADLIRRDGMMCEQHPGLEFEHDSGCAGPGMPWMVEGKDAITKLKVGQNGAITVAILRLIDMDANFTLKWDCHAKRWFLDVGWLGIETSEKSLLDTLTAALIKPAEGEG